MACRPAKCDGAEAVGEIGSLGWRVGRQSAAGMFRGGGSGATSEIGGWVACRRAKCGGDDYGAVVQVLEVRGGWVARRPM